MQYFREEFEAGMHTPAHELFPPEKSVLFDVRRTTQGVQRDGVRMTVTTSPRPRQRRRQGRQRPGAGRPDHVSLTIDGVPVSVPKGTLVIRAAETVGIEIPRFCDHPLLDPVGACRQCLVDVAMPDRDGNVRPMPKPQASCTMTVSEGMVVNTQHTSKVADKAQQGVMELLLINHPLDCPVCDKGGECPLQNQAMSAGRPVSRFEDVKRTYPKPVNISLAGPARPRALRALRPLHPLLRPGRR